MGKNFQLVLCSFLKRFMLTLQSLFHKFILYPILSKYSSLYPSNEYFSYPNVTIQRHWYLLWNIPTSSATTLISVLFLKLFEDCIIHIYKFGYLLFGNNTTLNEFHFSACEWFSKSNSSTTHSSFSEGLLIW